MLSYSKNILETLTGKSSVEEVSEEQLQQLVNKHPYFAAAQFMLAKKMYAANQESFKDVLQKTALHFDNTHLLHINFFEEDSDELDEFSNTENVNELPGTDVKTLSESETGQLAIAKENYHSDTDISEEEADVSDEEILHEAAFEPNEKLSSLLKEQAEAFEQPVEDTTLPIENIPHHRIDYFESQGVKLDPEKEANDKLGTQVKRFTDWLKQMKRINPNLNNIETDAAGEIQAQNMAARSNDPKEVLTETMAEVLIKQSKPEEAIHIYEKLSFSNPSKSAYFAAKIKELKAKQ